MEHGSAKWGNVSEICRRYCEKQYTQNLLLTQHFRMGLDGYKHKRNLNVLVVGGSGAGKSRTYAIPNIMQCNCSMVITDPKAELLRKTGGVLERNGYEVRVFDLINPETSWCYNPFAYVWDDKDVLKLINNLSTFIFSLIRAIGLILLGFGVVQVGLSLKSHDPSQRANGFLTLAGGVIITFAKEILDLIMA